MDNMEDKISAILNNPQLMQQIMSMAQSLGQSQQPRQEEPSEASVPPFSGIDPAAIQKIASLTQQSGIDSNQQALLQALSPYLSQDRVSRLERAMRAAKIARHASSFLGVINHAQPTGR